MAPWPPPLGTPLVRSNPTGRGRGVSRGQGASTEVVEEEKTRVIRLRLVEIIYLLIIQFIYKCSLCSSDVRDDAICIFMF